MSQSRTFPQPASKALAQFPRVFGDGVEYTSPAGAAWAPGRVNLIGEHTDYNNGFAMPISIDRYIALAGRQRSDAVVRLWSTAYEDYAQFSLAGLPATFKKQHAALPRWASYVLGVATEILRDEDVARESRLHGFDAVIDGDIPIGGGMSSSAALEVAAAHAFSLFSDETFTFGYHNRATLWPMRVVEICQRAEHIASGVQCGILDQSASLLGRAGEAVFLDCGAHAYRYIPFDDPQYALVVIDSGIRRDLAETPYNERRRECEEATRLLRQIIIRREPDYAFAPHIESLRDISDTQAAMYGAEIPAVLRRRVAFVQAEDARTMLASDLIEENDYAHYIVHTGGFDPALLDMNGYVALGKLMGLSHAGLRDLYEVSCPELDILVEIAASVPGVLGARMMGAGFGGCTINLVSTEAIEALRQSVEQEYHKRSGRRATIHICHATSEADYAWVE